MNKQILIIVTNLVLVNPLNASGSLNREHCFRPAFQKKLKRVHTISLGSFRSGSLRQNKTKKAVFIDWRKLYWGRLSDLIYSEVQEDWGEGREEMLETPDAQEQRNLSMNTEDTQAFAKELREELKAFARHYGFKIVWRKKALELPDVTDSFLDYWDRGTFEEQGTDLLRKGRQG